MGRYYWIIILVIVVWQVVASAVQNASKKQQKERQAAAERQRRQAGARGAPAEAAAGLQPGPRGGPASGPGVGGPAARREDLAARRKAQLEELRRRRQAALGGSPAKSMQVRVGQSRPAAPPPTPAPPRAKQIKTVAADFRGVQADREAGRRQRELQAQREKLGEDVHRLRREQEKDAQTAAVKAKRRIAEAAAPSLGLEREYGTRSDRSARTAAMNRVFRDRDRLRDLFVLKELLDVPVGLRRETPGIW